MATPTEQIKELRDTVAGCQTRLAVSEERILVLQEECEKLTAQKAESDARQAKTEEKLAESQKQAAVAEEQIALLQASVEKLTARQESAGERQARSKERMAINEKEAEKWSGRFWQIALAVWTTAMGLLGAVSLAVLGFKR